MEVITGIMQYLIQTDTRRLSMAFGGPMRLFITSVNTAVTALRHVPVLGAVIGRHITEISYVGRKSGRSFTLPVSYQVRGNTVTIRVSMPDKKSWWRNFLGAGGPLTIRLDGTDRPAHAVASRDAAGRVTVVATLDTGSAAS
ncbi:hypothetical protein [Mycolicibacterium mengxianglii]|uniref:hypothetical protein n=1 Tax=Mycolicibacterium mengxianglii TaxID=2736649 RepID=UPI001E61A466|nr:hypothetical protein [Mycolicibacterium mengxianglii]